MACSQTSAHGKSSYIHNCILYFVFVCGLKYPNAPLGDFGWTSPGLQRMATVQVLNGELKVNFSLLCGVVGGWVGNFSLAILPFL